MTATIFIALSSKHIEKIQITNKPGKQKYFLTNEINEHGHIPLKFHWNPTKSNCDNLFGFPGKNVKESRN